MNAKVLIAGVAIAAMASGAVSAKTMKHHKTSSGMSGGSYAAPSQPIPYAQMDSYMKASPRQRTAMMSGMSSDTAMSSGAAGTSNMGSAGADTGGVMSGSSMSTGSMSGGSMSPPVNSGTPPMAGSTTTTTPPTTTPPK